MRFIPAILRAFFLTALAGGAAWAQAVPDALQFPSASTQARILQLRQAWALNHRNSPDSAAFAPRFTAGKILTPIVRARTPPGLPVVLFQFETDSAGLSGLECEFRSPGGDQGVFVEYSATTAPTSGSVSVLNGQVNPYAEAGIYTLHDCEIFDYAGGYRTYSETQLSALFPKLTYTFVNPTSDSTKPIIGGGYIKTPNISLSSAREIFIAGVIVSDTGSGADDIQIILTDPNGVQYYSFAAPPSPITTASVFEIGLDLSLYSNVPTGTWTISTLNILDVAGNRVYITDARKLASIFGSTTFTVSK